MASIARAGPSRLPATVPALIRSFTTSASVQATGAKRKEIITTKRTRQSVMKGKLPSGGRGSGGRITLSYTGASAPPDLSSLEVLKPETVQERNIGMPTRFTDQAFGAMKQFGLPARIQDQMTKSGGPAFVIRDKTVQAVQILERASSQSSAEHRYLYTGARGSGKSAVLLQAVHHALESDWLVLYLPRIEQLVGSLSRYAYSKEEQIFNQPDLSSALLQHFLKVNQRLLKTLSISPQPDVPGVPRDRSSFKDASDMFRLIELARRTPDVAPMILRSVLKAVASQDKVPMLLAIDEAQALFGATKYRDPQYLPIQAYHLSVPLVMLDYMTGKECFSRGCVLTALSYSVNGAYRIPSAIVTAFDLPSKSDGSPYRRVNDVHLQHAASGIKQIHLENGMSPREAAGLYKIWQMKGWVRRASDEGFLNVLYSSAGNPAQFLKGIKNDLNLQPLA